MLNRSLVHRLLLFAPTLHQPYFLRHTGVPSLPIPWGRSVLPKSARFFYRRMDSLPLDPEILRLCASFFSYISGTNPFRIRSLDLTRIRRFRRLRNHHITYLWSELRGWKVRFFLDSLFLLVFPNLVLRNIKRMFSESGHFCLGSTFSDVTYITRLLGDDSDFTRLLDPLGTTLFSPPIWHGKYFFPPTQLFGRIARTKLLRASLPPS